MGAEPRAQDNVKNFDLQKLMILAKYILKEHIAPFIMAICVITFLFVVDFLVKILDNVLSKGIPIETVIEVFVLNLAWMLSLSVPMAVLVASLMAFGRLSGDQEITAVKAAGISPFTLMRPVLLVSLLLSELLVLFNNWVLPEANHRSVELMSAISRKQPHAFIDAGRLITQFPGVQLWVNSIDPSTGRLYGVQFFEIQKKGPPRFVYADSAEMQYVDGGATLLFSLLSGENHVVDADAPANYFRIRFSAQELAMANVNDRLERKGRSYRSDREMPVDMMMDVVKSADSTYQALTAEFDTTLFVNLRRLQAAIAGDSVVPDSVRAPEQDSVQMLRALQRVKTAEKNDQRSIKNGANRLEGEVKRQAQYLVEIHKKFSTSFACFIFILIGAPLGIMARKGGIGTGIIYSLAFFVIYWVSLIGGENWADRLLVPPEVAMWFSNVIIGIFGIFITYKMLKDRYSGDSKIKNFIRKIKEFFKKKDGRRKTETL